jgi:hypothetical protein
VVQCASDLSARWTTLFCLFLRPDFSIKKIPIGHFFIDKCSINHMFLWKS